MNEIKPFGLVQDMSVDELREFIGFIEEISKESPQVEVPMAHHFSKGVYAREMRMKAGDLVVGKIHRFENLHVISQGEASVLSADGGVVRVKAPYTFVASPGAKRVIFAHTDLVWTTIHGTLERDLEKIEDEVIAPDYSGVQWLDGQIKPKLIGE